MINTRTRLKSREAEYRENLGTMIDMSADDIKSKLAELAEMDPANPGEEAAILSEVNSLKQALRYVSGSKFKSNSRKPKGKRTYGADELDQVSDRLLQEFYKVNVGLGEMGDPDMRSAYQAEMDKRGIKYKSKREDYSLKRKARPYNIAEAEAAWNKLSQEERHGILIHYVNAGEIGPNEMDSTPSDEILSDLHGTYGDAMREKSDDEEESLEDWWRSLSEGERYDIIHDYGDSIIGFGEYDPLSNAIDQDPNFENALETIRARGKSMQCQHCHAIIKSGSRCQDCERVANSQGAQFNILKAKQLERKWDNMTQVQRKKALIPIMRYTQIAKNYTGKQWYDLDDKIRESLTEQFKGKFRDITDDEYNNLDSTYGVKRPIRSSRTESLIRRLRNTDDEEEANAIEDELADRGVALDDKGDLDILGGNYVRGKKKT